MRRAAQRVRKPGRAGEYTWSESAATELPEIRPLRNPSTLSFSQSHGYGEIPSPLKLEYLPSEARTKLWNTLYGHLAECLYEDEDVGGVLISSPWNRILRAKHLHFDLLGMDEWSPLYHDAGHQLRDQIKTMRFNRVFDLIQFILRHPECPPTVAASMKKAFSDSRLAYAIDENDPQPSFPLSPGRKDAFSWNPWADFLRLAWGKRSPPSQGMRLHQRKRLGGKHPGEHSCRRICGTTDCPKQDRHVHTGTEFDRKVRTLASQP